MAQTGHFREYSQPRWLWRETRSSPNRAGRFATHQNLIKELHRDLGNQKRFAMQPKSVPETFRRRDQPEIIQTRTAGSSPGNRQTAKGEKPPFLDWRVTMAGEGARCVGLEVSGLIRRGYLPADDIKYHIAPVTGYLSLDP
jgi:hypothetical protein